MKLSIITTIYKAEKDLPRLLDSMIAQRSPELEFFLIDNGSPDRCGEIASEYAKKDSRFVIYTIKENIGYIRARNEGIRVCTGDYIGFCDSDDFLEPGAYDHAISKIRETECDLYLTSFRTKSEESEGCITEMPYRLGLFEGEEVHNKILPAAFGMNKNHTQLPGFMWKEIFKRSVITDNGFLFNERLKPYEDQIFNIDVLGVCDRVYVDDNVIYNYIINDKSITAQNAIHFDAAAEYHRVTALFEEKKKRAVEKSQMESAANSALFGLYSILLSLAKQTERSLSDRAEEAGSIFHGKEVKEILSLSNVRYDKALVFVSFCLHRRFFCLIIFCMQLAVGRN